MQYDLIVAGGGLAGSSLATVLARDGARVLLLEAESRFEDRVRGEALLPWGVAEAHRLGLRDVFESAGAKPLPFRDNHRRGTSVSRQSLVEESRSGEPILSFPHAAVQEALIQAAVAAGAFVLRGARVRAVEPGCSPAVDYEVDGRLGRAEANLIVGADGRSSRVRAEAGFEVESGAAGLLTTGVALRGLALDEEAVAAAVNTGTRESASLLPQGGGRARAYLTYRAGETREGVPRDVPELVKRFVAAGLPAEMFSGAAAAGPLATFDGTPRWVDFPYRRGVALIGDAAATSDPAWGQGMSLALRDVRALAGSLAGGGGADDIGFRYAREHDGYSVVNRIVSRLVTQGQFEDGSAAADLRASDFWRRHGRRLRAVHLDGPDTDLSGLLIPGLAAPDHSTAASPPDAMATC